MNFKTESTMITPSISNVCQPTEGATAESYAANRQSARIFEFGPNNRFVAFKYVEAQGQCKYRTAFVLGTTTAHGGALEYVVTTNDDPNKPNLFTVSAADVCLSLFFSTQLVRS